ncbi:hypothetical protein HAX54_011514, partial [Datura stramonium]|nr:hypothetical protein [Datura stramonium]
MTNGNQSNKNVVDAQLPNETEGQIDLQDEWTETEFDVAYLNLARQQEDAKGDDQGLTTIQAFIFVH